MSLVSRGLGFHTVITRGLGGVVESAPSPAPVQPLGPGRRQTTPLPIVRRASAHSHARVIVRNGGYADAIEPTAARVHHRIACDDDAIAGSTEQAAAHHQARRLATAAADAAAIEPATAVVAVIAQHDASADADVLHAAIASEPINHRNAQALAALVLELS